MFKILSTQFTTELFTQVSEMVWKKVKRIFFLLSNSTHSSRQYGEDLLLFVSKVNVFCLSTRGTQVYFGYLNIGRRTVCWAKYQWIDPKDCNQAIFPKPKLQCIIGPHSWQGAWPGGRVFPWGPPWRESEPSRFRVSIQLVGFIL